MAEDFLNGWTADDVADFAKRYLDAYIDDCRCFMERYIGPCLHRFCRAYNLSYDAESVLFFYKGMCVSADCFLEGKAPKLAGDPVFRKTLADFYRLLERTFFDNRMLGELVPSYPEVPVEDTVEKQWDKFCEKEGIFNACPSLEFSPYQIARYGDCFFQAHRGNKLVFTAKSRPDPTWGEILKEFDKSIDCTLDYHNVYLEGIEEIGDLNGYPVYTFITGS